MNNNLEGRIGSYANARDPELSVIILLSTYNGEKYLAEQIDSIKAQTFSHWQLLIRDDGSSDTTTDIIKQYIATDTRIHLIEDNLGNLNAAHSFSALMVQAIKFQPNYVFFCDQDDVWLKDKLAMQVMQLIQLEQQYGAQIPLLVHSDLQVVDSHKNMLHHSFLEFENIKRNANFPLKTLLINNFITGCTIGMNKTLLLLASPLPKHVMMHDWWCGLCAAAAGKIAFLNHATILYRQHGKNTIGSGGFYGKMRDVLLGKMTPGKRIRNLRLCFAQANELLERLKESRQQGLVSEKKGSQNNFGETKTTNLGYEIVQQFNDLKHMRFVRRYPSAIKLRLVPSSTFRGVMFWLLLCIV